MKVTGRTKLLFAIFGIVTILGAWQVLTGDSLITQMRNMKRAREFAPIVRAKFETIPELRHVRVSEFTGAGGSLMVRGDLASNAEVIRVREIVESTLPPVKVVYRLFATNELR